MARSGGNSSNVFIGALALVALLCGGSPLAAQVPGAPVVMLSATSVSASGVTAGGAVAWFSVARVIEDLAVRVVSRSEIVVDADGDGIVELDLAGPLPLKSVWVVVDLASGLYTAAAPEGSPLVEGNILGKVENGELAVSRPLVHLFRARTGEEGVGAWALRAGDGGESDDDGLGDGLLHAGLSRFTDGAGVAAPAEVTGSDLLVVIDPSRLDYQIVRGDV
jgi:hypothetical protein